MLGNCLKAETEAAARLRTLEDGIRRDRAASGSADLLEFADMFAARRNTAQVDRRTATMAMSAAELGTAEARAAVAVARTAAETVQRLIDERAALQDAERTRQEQHVLDDIARPRPNR